MKKIVFITLIFFNILFLYGCEENQFNENEFSEINKIKENEWIYIIKEVLVEMYHYEDQNKEKYEKIIIEENKNFSPKIQKEVTKFFKEEYGAKIIWTRKGDKGEIKTKKYIKMDIKEKENNGGNNIVLNNSFQKSDSIKYSFYTLLEKEGYSWKIKKMMHPNEIYLNGYE